MGLGDAEGGGESEGIHYDKKKTEALTQFNIKAIQKTGGKLGI